MIDTIRFSIPYSTQLKNDIYKSGANIITSYDSDTLTTHYKYIRGYKTIGSYDRNINLFIYEDSEKIFLELSLPKYIYGHNIWMLYPEEVETTIYRLWANLNKVYNTTFPTPEYWDINRLDVCYNWKFDSQETAEKILNYLKGFNFPRKQKQLYKSGIFSNAGKLHTIKFYLKQQEFFKHDFKEMKKDKNQLERAYNLYGWSSGVLRFEVSLKRLWLEQKFPQIKRINYHIAKQCDIISPILGEFLDSYLKMDNKNFISINNALDKLYNFYPKPKAQRLATYWFLISTQEEETVKLLHKYNKSTHWRNIQDLKNANIGFYLDDNIKDLNLSIPSNLATNFKTSPLVEGESPDER